MKKRNYNKHWYIDVIKKIKDINRHILKRTRPYSLRNDRDANDSYHGHRYRLVYKTQMKFPGIQDGLKYSYRKIKYLCLHV